MHPLAPDLTNLSDDELFKKRSELTERLNLSYRMGHTQMIMQLQLLLNDYNMEYQRRNQKMLEDAAANKRNFQDKIDITR
jgi:hypothetical protein